MFARDCCGIESHSPIRASGLRARRCDFILIHFQNQIIFRRQTQIESASLHFSVLFIGGGTNHSSRRGVQSAANLNWARSILLKYQVVKSPSKKSGGSEKNGATEINCERGYL
jgi:hypothetical protein